MRSATHEYAGAVAPIHFRIDELENHEDIQHVFSNLEVSDAAMEALA